jgi:putative addiction module CopG family antidote
MNAIVLPPDLEQYAAEAVASGRFRDLTEVVRAGISMLRRAEAARAALLASVVAAEEEGTRDGYVTSGELLERVDARLSHMSKERTRPALGILHLKPFGT